METMRSELLMFYTDLGFYILIGTIFALFLLIRWMRKRKGSEQKPLEDLYDVVEESVYEGTDNMKNLIDNIKKDFKK